jgi:hypothetical protein
MRADGQVLIVNPGDDPNWVDAGIEGLELFGPAVVMIDKLIACLLADIGDLRTVR